MIYFMRHGLDDENYIGGHSNIDLIAEGISQVEKSAEFIRNNLMIKKIITSDIRRSVTSAEIVKSYLNDKVDLVKSSLLRELDKGDLTGRNKKMLSKEELEILKMDDINRCYPNGESMQDMYNRVLSLLENGYFSDKDNYLIVTHRGIINMLYFILNGEKLTMDKTKFNVVHASIHEVDIEKKKIKRIF